jgi:hypothetical protein
MINRKRCMDEGLTTSSKVKKRHHSIQHDTQVRQRWYMYFVVDRSIRHHHTESLSRYRLLSRFGRSFFRSFVRSLFQGGSYADNEHARRLERAGRYVWMASTGLWLD